MICAHCGSETAETPCSACALSPLLGGRYRLLKTVQEAEDEVLAAFLATCAAAGLAADREGDRGDVRIYRIRWASYLS